MTHRQFHLGCTLLWYLDVDTFVFLTMVLRWASWYIFVLSITVCHNFSCDSSHEWEGSWDFHQIGKWISRASSTKFVYLFLMLFNTYWARNDRLGGIQIRLHWVMKQQFKYHTHTITMSRIYCFWISWVPLPAVSCHLQG